MYSNFNDDTPIVLLTVGQLKEILISLQKSETINIMNPEKKYVYGISGIASIFNCSIPTANRIKARGKIKNAITQIGRKIIVDVDLALKLASQKEGGRK
ncbi:MAG: DUF3853 family protein [Bacteroidota bacterium]